MNDASLMQSKLTRRQQQVLQMLVDGKTCKQIAVKLGIKRKTVDNHVAAARKKYQVDTRDELIARAVARGDVYVFMGEAKLEIPLVQLV